MNKNTLIVVAVSMLLAIILFSISIITKSPAPKSGNLMDIMPYQNDEAELNLFEKDLVAYDQNENIFIEIDQTYSDILDLSESAFDEDSILKEGVAVDFSEDLKSFSDDETALGELDQTFVEISQ
jgi:hypothetical protein